MRRIYIGMMIALFLSPYLLHAGVWDTLTPEILSHHPSLLAQEHKVEALRKTILPAAFPTDPVFKMTWMNQPVDSSVQSPMSALQFMASQNMPFPTKLGLRTQIQKRLMEKEQAVLRDMKLTLYRDIKLSALRLVMVRKQIAIESERREKLKLFYEIALTKYGSGKGLQQDLLNISLNINQSKKRILKMQIQLSNDIQQLFYLLPEGVGQEWITKLLDFPGMNQSQAGLHPAHPSLLVLQAAVDLQKTRLSLARWDYLPNLGLSLAYNVRDNGLSDGGVDQFSVGVSASVPLFSLTKQLPQVQEQKKLLKQLQQVLADKMSKMQSQLNSHLSAWQLEKELLDLYTQSILHESEQAWEQSLESYQVDQLEFINVLQNLLALYQQQIDFVASRASVHQHAAWIEYYTWRYKGDL